jgi:sugar lactone lactonase YvrE
MRSTTALLALTWLLAMTAPAHAAAVSTLAAGLTEVSALAFDPGGTLFALQRSPGAFTGAIVKIAPDGTVTPFVSGLDDVLQMVFDSSGNLFLSDYGQSRVLKVTPAGTVSTFATIAAPHGIVIDPSGNLYVNEYFNQTVDEITPTGVVSVVATNVGPVGQRAVSLARDVSGNLYVSTLTSSVITRVTPAGAKSTFATGTGGNAGMTLGPDGNWYVSGYASGTSAYNKILRITPAGAVSVAAGTGVLGSLDGPALSATFAWPWGVAFGPDERLYVADNNTGRVRIIDFGFATPARSSTWVHIKRLYR